MDLTCPRCQGAMQQLERAGVVIDRCRDCRGLFLDRGELERLVDAENRRHGGSEPGDGTSEGGSARTPGEQGPQGRYPAYGSRSFLDQLLD